jgi:hypothetical protein
MMQVFGCDHKKSNIPFSQQIQYLKSVAEK